MRIMWFSFYLYDKAQSFDLATVFNTSSHNINTGGIDATVSQNVSKLGDIPLDSVECPGKQLPKVMRKHLRSLNTRSFAKLLHLPPDIASVKGLSTLAHEDCPCCDMLLLGII